MRSGKNVTRRGMPSATVKERALWRDIREPKRGINHFTWRGWERPHRGGEIQFSIWFGLDNHVIQNSYTRTLPPNEIIFGRKLGLDPGMRVEPFLMEFIHVLTRVACLFLLSIMGEHREKTSMYDPGSRVSPDVVSTGIFPELRNKHLRHCCGLCPRVHCEKLGPQCGRTEWLLRPTGSIFHRCDKNT